MALRRTDLLWMAWEEIAVDGPSWYPAGPRPTFRPRRWRFGWCGNRPPETEEIFGDRRPGPDVRTSGGGGEGRGVFAAGERAGPESGQAQRSFLSSCSLSAEEVESLRRSSRRGSSTLSADWQLRWRALFSSWRTRVAASTSWLWRSSSSERERCSRLAADSWLGRSFSGEQKWRGRRAACSWSEEACGGLCGGTAARICGRDSRGKGR